MYGRRQRRRQRFSRCGVLHVQHGVRGRSGVLRLWLRNNLIPRCRYALGSIMGPTLGLWMVQGIGMRVTYALFGSGIAVFR